MIDNNIVINLLSASNFGTYNKFLVRKLGLVESIILSELISMYQYTTTNNLKDEFAQKDEFFFQQQRLADELSMHITTINKYIKSLCNLKIIIINKRGVPCKSYYKINFDTIYALLSNKESLLTPIKSSFRKIQKLDLAKCENQFSKNSKTSISKIQKEINNNTNNKINNNISNNNARAREEKKAENKEDTPYNIV